MEYIITPTTITNKVMCIYKMIFDNGQYYIGGTCDLNKRITRHKKDIKNAKHAKAVNLAAACSNTIRFEILEFVNNRNDIKKREEYKLTYHVGLPLCLNTSEISSNNFGNRFNKFKVSVFNERNNLVGTFNSVIDAATKIGVSYHSACDNVTGKTSRVKNGFYFRRIDVAGEIIEPGLVRKKIMNYGKPVIQYDVNGNKLKKYKNIHEAALDIGSDRKTIRESMVGRRKTPIKNQFYYKFG